MMSRVPSSTTEGTSGRLAGTTEGGGSVRVSVGCPDGMTVDVTMRGTGPPVLLIHGFGGSAAAWGESVLGRLAPHHRLLAVDLPGHGASDDPSGAERVSLARVLDDLERVLDAAAVESCAWVGYSLGGRIALAAALLRPARVERLVLESASPGLATETERRERRSADEALARTIERDGVGAWIEEWERRPLFAGRARLPDERRERFLTLRRANRPRALAAWLRGLGAGSQPSFWTRLTELAVPTLLVSGTCDHKYTGLVELMAGAIPRATHVAVEGAGHRVHLERPEPWLEAVLLFLTGEPPQR